MSLEVSAEMARGAASARSPHDVLGLDVGGVLLRSPWELLRERYGDGTNAAKALYGPLSDGTDTAYDEMLAGTITETQYWRHFCEEVRGGLKDFADSEDPVRDLIARSSSPLRQSMIEWVQSFVAAGGSVVTFSNGLYRTLGRAWWQASVPGGIISMHIDASETGIRKPDVRAFRPLLMELEASPSRRAMYVDDNPHYAAAAESTGVPSLWFRITHQSTCLEKMSAFYGR